MKNIRLLSIHSSQKTIFLNTYTVCLNLERYQCSVQRGMKGQYSRTDSVKELAIQSQGSFNSPQVNVAIAELEKEVLTAL